MEKAQRLLTQGFYLTYPHALLWAATERYYKTSQKVKRGRTYFDLATLLGIALTLEAYVNLLLMILFPADWKQERQLFKRGGVMGKISHMCRKLGIVEPDKTTRPYRSIVSISKLRDEVVHAKPEKRDYSYVHKGEPGISQLTPTWLANKLTHENAKKTMQDFKKFLEDFHSIVLAKVRRPPASLPRNPLSGIYSVGNWSTKAISAESKLPPGTTRLSTRIRRQST